LPSRPLRTYGMDILTDADQVRPTPAHLGLLGVALPRPRDVVVTRSIESGLGLLDVALWIVDLRSVFGTFVWEAAMNDDALRARFIGFAEKRGVPPVFATATSVQGALLFMAEALPDLLIHVHARPVGTMVVVIGDEHDDVRLLFIVPDDLEREH
jgi:hypothetical protein